jgi:hypothetical protein
MNFVTIIFSLVSMTKTASENHFIELKRKIPTLHQEKFDYTVAGSYVYVPNNHEHDVRIALC